MLKNVSLVNHEESAIEDRKIKQLVKDKYGVDWDEQISPQIDDIVIKTIQSCNHKII